MRIFSLDRKRFYFSYDELARRYSPRQTPNGSNALRGDGRIALIDVSGWRCLTMRAR
jgi:hypothetical protein